MSPRATDSLEFSTTQASKPGQPSQKEECEENPIMKQNNMKFTQGLSNVSTEMGFIGKVDGHTGGARKIPKLHRQNAMSQLKDMVNPELPK